MFEQAFYGYCLRCGKPSYMQSVCDECWEREYEEYKEEEEEEENE